ncbi:transcriptional regulator with XRE-family HTH domain [Oikeobacillus pervagus]|uniref:Transcriptional regulator with XRE-family HTH domain n=1 Tax=Oikeobacillus pervagus TaxID=1325931 RepID=A0AAJ1SZI2_9BACI|nr:helix-turn-helix transcriptional regulator [Oikeobacillus pervagus]MDQ0214102.1 transcriptional regulator with XRE-family HTH domain [Oikeobacillus pervagus]
MSLHENLRKYRCEVLKEGQAEMALRLNVSQPTISKYESGDSNITVDMLKNIKVAYHIPDDLLIDWLLDEQTSHYDAGLLREKVSQLEDQEINQLLEDYPELKKNLLYFTYLSEQDRDKKVAGINEIFKVLKSWK